METMKIVIPEALKRRFKKACIDHDSNMSEVVCLLVESWLSGAINLQPDPNQEDTNQ
jgi:hypothetical protein